MMIQIFDFLPSTPGSPGVPGKPSKPLSPLSPLRPGRPSKPGIPAAPAQLRGINRKSKRIFELYYQADPLPLGNPEDLQLLECQHHPMNKILTINNKTLNTQNF